MRYQESFQIYYGTEKDIIQTNIQLMNRLNINNRTPHTGSTVHIKHEDCYICVTLSSETQGLLSSQQIYMVGEQWEDNHALAITTPQKEMSIAPTGYATQAD